MGVIHNRRECFIHEGLFGRRGIVWVRKALNIINRFVMIISRRIWSMLSGGQGLRFGLALLRFPLPDLGEKIK
jgi:hypothetical protein